MIQSKFQWGTDREIQQIRKDCKYFQSNKIIFLLPFRIERDAQLLKIKFEPSYQIEWQDETIGC